MRFRLIRYFFLLIFYSFSNCILAQEDVYVAEIGFNTGGSFYIGDANSQLFNNTQFAFGPFIRYNVDPRFSVKAEMGFTQIVQYYDLAKTNKWFQNPIKSIDICAEYNFFDLEKLDYKLFSKTFSPYIFAGGGAMEFLYDKYNPNANKTDPLPIFVFGVGMKIMVTKGINFNFQWSNRLLISDSGDTMEGFSTLNHSLPITKKNPIEGQPDIVLNPNPNGSNPFNNDLLSTMTVGISFDIWKKQCDCLNMNKKEKRSRK